MGHDRMIVGFRDYRGKIFLLRRAYFHLKGGGKAIHI
jgi:hypothetical protein